MLAFVFALALALAPAPHVDAFLSLGTSELAYDGLTQTTATASLYSTAPVTLTVQLDASDVLLLDRTPRHVFVAPGQPATLHWRVALDQTSPRPSRWPVTVRLLVDGVERASAPVRVWAEGQIAYVVHQTWLPVVRRFDTIPQR